MYVAPLDMRRIEPGWPRWLPSRERSFAARVCEARARGGRKDAPAMAGDAGMDDGERLRTSEWVEQYPLGPLSAGVGFVSEGIQTWRRWAPYFPPPIEPGPLRMTVQTLDGAIDCVSRVMIARAVQTRSVAECNEREARPRAVVMHAVINKDGWIAPIDASVDRADVALAQCIAAAIHRPAGLVHGEQEGVETVFVVQWGYGRGVR